MNRFRLFLLLSAGAFLVGCTSLNVHSEDRKPSIYPGFREDCSNIPKLWSEPFGAFLVWYPVVDMPFSFAVDTLYLPSDIIAVTRYKQPDSTLVIETNNTAH